MGKIAPLLTLIRATLSLALLACGWPDGLLPGPTPAAAAPAAATGRSATRPNIVFIFTDDQRWDEMSCAGHPFLKTPHIDRLAAEGARFANMFVTTSLCSPSRASFLSGLYANTHGVSIRFT